MAADEGFMRRVQALVDRKTSELIMDHLTANLINDLPVPIPKGQIVLTATGWPKFDYKPPSEWEILECFELWRCMDGTLIAKRREGEHTRTRLAALLPSETLGA